MTNKTRSSHESGVAVGPAITAALALAFTGLVSACGDSNEGYTQKSIPLCGENVRVQSVLATDLDGDGVEDAAVGCLTDDEPLKGHLAIWLSDGAGNLEQKQTIEMGTHDTGGEGADIMTAADFNEDGNPDLVVFDKAGNKHRNALLYGQGDGTFGDPEYFSPQRAGRWASASDVNDDGHQDLIVATGGNGRRYLPGDGGKLDTSAHPRYMGPPAKRFYPTDINDDGRPDAVLLVKKRHTLSIYYSGDARQELPLGKSHETIKRVLSGGPADGDDRNDLLVETWDGDVRRVRWLLTENGPHLGEAIDRATQDDVKHVVDYNHDGRADLLIEPSGQDAEDSPTRRTLLMGQAGGGFEKTGALDLPGGLQGLWHGDFNADGKPDFVYRYIDEDYNPHALVYFSQAE